MITCTWQNIKEQTNKKKSKSKKKIVQKQFVKTIKILSNLRTNFLCD